MDDKQPKQVPLSASTPQQINFNTLSQTIESAMVKSLSTIAAQGKENALQVAGSKVLSFSLSLFLSFSLSLYLFLYLLPPHNFYMYPALFLFLFLHIHTYTHAQFHIQKNKNTKTCALHITRKQNDIISFICSNLWYGLQALAKPLGNMCLFFSSMSSKKQSYKKYCSLRDPSWLAVFYLQ